MICETCGLPPSFEISLVTYGEDEVGEEISDPWCVCGEYVRDDQGGFIFY